MPSTRDSRVMTLTTMPDLSRLGALGVAGSGAADWDMKYRTEIKAP